MTLTLSSVGHDVPPRTDSIAELLQSYRRDQSNALAAKIMTLVGQDKAIRTKLLKPHKFGRDKDRSEAEPYKADQNS